MALSKALTELFWETNIHRFSTKKNTSSLPERLFHYTNIDGIMGIIGSNQLWMTHSDFLNDSSEIVYLKELEGEVLQKFELLMKEEIEEKGLRIYNEIVSEFKGSFNTRYKDEVNTNQVFVLSLSENKDSLVLWGNYAKGDGFNIGFETKELLDKIIDEEEKFRLVYDSVKYDRNEQIDILVEMLNKTYKKIEEISEVDFEFKQELSMYFRSVLLTYSIFFKHVSFKPEEEFRVAAVTIGEFKPTLTFRSSNGNIIPYIAPEFEKLPVKSINIGPKNNSDIAEKGLKIYLESCALKMHETEINRSKVPLRY